MTVSDAYLLSYEDLHRQVSDAACAWRLMWMGVAPSACGTRSVVLLGCDADFWPYFQDTAAYRDGQHDPLDRWSRQAMAALQRETGAVDVAFPFGGPPYAPFLRWAEESGTAWQSPVGMLIHDRAGLMISYRGALVFEGRVDTPAPQPSPCDTCDAQPCATACPVDALSAERGYNVAACHAFLDTSEGADCLNRGCKARRACPVSQAFGRDPAQSAFHMASFHPT